MPAFRQLGHLSFSTQQSRAIQNMRPNPETFPMSLRRHSVELKGTTAKIKKGSVTYEEDGKGPGEHAIVGGVP
jgi:hypothetical protein